MTLQPIWHKRKHALNSALDHSGEITDAQHGIRTLLNAHALPDLSGIISDVQHGDKTTIPDAHHSKLHQASHLEGQPDHFAHVQRLRFGASHDATEVSTSSTTFVLLQSTFTYAVLNDIWLFIFFTHNAKNTGTLASRGATYRFTYQKEGGTEYTIADYRWTDNLADYKCMTVIIYLYAIVGAGSKITVRVYWTVDEANYPAYSKERFLILQVQDTEKTARAPQA